ncbi:MAG: ester cyclase [Acidobacteria bacterium]|nr:ester cyclase [Acidobacteriota bacterium]MBV9474502.1 ester cyclase [Acidobacteriota bacterium]
MSAESNKQLVRRLIEEAQEGGRLEVVDELLGDDFVDYSPMPGLPPTRDGVRMLFAGLRAAFPDLRITIGEQIADDEKVVTRKTFDGTHRGPFLGVPASGNRVAFEVIDILTVRDDRIREHRVVLDRLSLLQQLGAS